MDTDTVEFYEEAQCRYRRIIDTFPVSFDCDIKMAAAAKNSFPNANDDCMGTCDISEMTPWEAKIPECPLCRAEKQKWIAIHPPEMSEAVNHSAERPERELH